MKKHQKGFILNIVIIAVVLAVVFLSQSASFRPIAKNVYVQANSTIGPYATKASDWFGASIYPKLSGEVNKRGETVKNEITNQKNNAAQSLWERVKNYFAEKFSKISGTKVK